MTDETLTSPVVIRPARAEDAGTILGFIRALARFERLEDRVTATEGDLGRWVFGDSPVASVLLAFENGELAGFALYFPNFSTFLGRPGIYLEDLFVREASRGHGIGTALLRHLAALAVERGWGRVEWAVLDWNAPAIRFYESIGATVMPDWRVCRLTGTALERLGRTD